VTRLAAGEPGAGASLALSPEKSVAESGAPVRVRAKWLPSLSEPALLASSTKPPMRSGMASVTKPTNDSEPSTNAAQGAQRQVSSLGIPRSRIREEA
jgi:hypothetical protein